MKKVIGLLMFAFAALVSFQSFANTSSGPYLVTEVGTLHFAGLTPSHTEKSIMNKSGVTSDYSNKDKGTYGAIGLGWSFNQYFSADVSYLRGIKLQTTTHITSFDAGKINIGGKVISLGKYPTDITLEREGEAAAARLGLNGQYPLTNWFSVAGNIEAYRWKADVVNKIMFDSSGLYVGYNESDHGTALAASAGFVLKPTNNIDVVLRYRHSNKITMPSLTLIYGL